ncbi:hypothetical protein OOT46_10260 [Aquabacterium sp. A7-Y]|uniref:AAA family ATPase n=1 Tax=Aquabacterium sp. A7-Y TaxID=1349605 RepID=UPI00223CD451|nr:AAA family ATPase [Aquabacterium sp. A7-Y]MCW7538230.1 hypothetical protein [Aquabacterium sp. A7-Y]
MDNRHFPRTALAQRYLDRLLSLPDRALSIFGPRQIGKTTLLSYDLAELARRHGLTPIYVDFMASEDPLLVLLGRLEDRLLDMNSRPGRTAVTRVSAAGFGLGLAPPPPSARSADAGVQMQHCMAAMKRLEPGTRLLLMLDEAQELVRKKDGERAMKAIRALFNTYRPDILLLITGSSREGLLRLFGEHHRASFGLADHEDFQVMGREFVDFVVEPVNRQLREPLDPAVLGEAFALLGHRPADFVAYVAELVMHPTRDIVGQVPAFLARRYPVEAVRERFERLTPLQQVLLQLIAGGATRLTSMATVDAVAERLGTRVSDAGIRKALASLPSDTLAKPSRGVYEIVDPQLQAWLREQIALGRDA